MFSRSGKLILILLIPALLYGVLKGVLYYNAKKSVEDIVDASAHMADVRYDGIDTEIRGAVTVTGITVQPLGIDDTVAVDSIRIASDDPMFFIRGGNWQPGEGGAPPNSLSFQVSGARLPLSSEMLRDAGQSGSADPCAEGLDIQPELLQKIGFSELTVDLDGHFRIDEASRTLDVGINMDLHDIESVAFSATMNDVDVETFSHGGAPQFTLGRLNFALRVAPEFGRRALEACAADSDATPQEWGERLAESALAQLRDQGLSLGPGLSGALRDFYRDWGEFELVAAPPQPVGLLSLMFLPPNQLADALSLRLSLNSQPITDTSFAWQQPQGQGLAGLFGGAQQGTEGKAEARPRRVLVRRSYEGVAVSQIGQYVGEKVQLKPRGQPMREGLLHRVGAGEAEVQQIVHGGKYSVHVPLGDIESLKVLVRREVKPGE